MPRDHRLAAPELVPVRPSARDDHLLPCGYPLFCVAASPTLTKDAAVPLHGTDQRPVGWPRPRCGAEQPAGALSEHQDRRDAYDGRNRP